jgi:hypothetical protein
LEHRQEFAEGRIELAAIGTIADMMPLTGHNRVLAAVGLKALAQTQRPGLQQMYQLASLKPNGSVSMYEVGFVIGPRLNAPGRLGDALESLRLLCTKDVDRAKKLAQDLHQLNAQRQDLLQVVIGQAKKELLARPSADAYVLVNPEWQAGVSGITSERGRGWQEQLHSYTAAQLHRCIASGIEEQHSISPGLRPRDSARGRRSSSGWWLSCAAMQLCSYVAVPLRYTLPHAP